MLALVACAKGTLDNAQNFGVSVSTTQSSSASNGDDDESTTDADDGSESEGGTAGSDPATTDPATTESAGTDPGESSGVLEESSSGAPITTMSEESSSTGGGPVLPDVGPWEACDLADCELGNDCIGLTGLRSYAPYCSPVCVTDDDCPFPDDGDALPVCALSVDDADPTNCALLCEVDGVPYGTCPGGMSCAEVPDQPTPVSICMWP
jgi:hypothetical protein